MSLHKLPSHSRPYKRTPDFSETTLPAGLRRMHETKPGVWGKICVTEGKLLLRFVENGEKQMLTPGQPGVVAPREAHEVEPFGPVRFYIEFYSETPEDQPHAAPGDEPPASAPQTASPAPQHPKMFGKVAPPGLDEALIRLVVDSFYDKVRADDLIGPVFDGVIAPDQWPHHLGKMYDFWSSLLLGTGRYEGRPLPKHLAIPELADPHFVRWLALFKETVETLCEAETAALFIDRSERIAQSFRLGLAFHRGGNAMDIKPLRAGEPAPAD